MSKIPMLSGISFVICIASALDNYLFSHMLGQLLFSCLGISHRVSYRYLYGFVCFTIGLFTLVFSIYVPPYHTLKLVKYDHRLLIILLPNFPEYTVYIYIRPTRSIGRGNLTSENWNYQIYMYMYISLVPSSATSVEPNGRSAGHQRTCTYVSLLD